MDKEELTGIVMRCIEGGYAGPIAHKFEPSHILGSPAREMIRARVLNEINRVRTERGFPPTNIQIPEFDENPTIEEYVEKLGTRLREWQEVFGEKWRSKKL